MNREEKKQVNEKDKDPEDEEIDLYPPRKVRIKEDKKTRSKRLQSNHSPINSSAKSVESFSDLLLPNVIYKTVFRMRYVHNAATRRHTWSSGLSFGSFSDLDIAPHPLFWKIVDVPGDGNCVIYATVLSMHFCNLRFGTFTAMHPRACRNKISTLRAGLSESDVQTRESFLRNSDLFSSRRGVARERLSGILGSNNSLHMMALWLKIGSPHSCL